jgi:hypothetical protein
MDGPWMWVRCRLCDEVVIVPRPFRWEDFRKNHKCSVLEKTEEVSE